MWGQKDSGGIDESRRRKVFIRVGSVIFVCHIIFFMLPLQKTYAPISLKKAVVVHTRTLPPVQQRKPAAAPAKKKVTKAYTPPIKKGGNRQKALLQKEVEKILTKIEIEQKKVDAPISISIPKKIDLLEVNMPLPENKKEQEDSLRDLDCIVGQLKENLKLPEYGKVQIELTLFENGRVKNIRILSSENERNSRYLERSLVNMIFPPFLNELKGKREYTFIFGFCNDE